MKLLAITLLVICSIVSASEIPEEFKENGQLVESMIVEIETESGCELIVTSGLRSPEHNKRVGGAKNSKHLTNSARDVILKDPNCLSYEKLWKIACKYGTGLLESDHLHIDIREEPLCLNLKK